MRLTMTMDTQFDYGEGVDVVARRLEEIVCTHLQNAQAEDTLRIEHDEGGWTVYVTYTDGGEDGTRFTESDWRAWRKIVQAMQTALDVFENIMESSSEEDSEEDREEDRELSEDDVCVLFE